MFAVDKKEINKEKKKIPCRWDTISWYMYITRNATPT